MKSSARVFFFFITLGHELSDTKSLKYEPSSELLLITAKQLFLNRELYRVSTSGAQGQAADWGRERGM